MEKADSDLCKADGAFEKKPRSRAEPVWITPRHSLEDRRRLRHEQGE